MKQMTKKETLRKAQVLLTYIFELGYTPEDMQVEWEMTEPEISAYVSEVMQALNLISVQECQDTEAFKDYSVELTADDVERPAMNNFLRTLDRVRKEVQ